MLTLYFKPGCPFCNRVLATIDQLRIEDVEMKDITESEDVVNELIEKGGKKQVPYFVDTEHDVAIYESDDIVDHLKKHHGADAPTQKPRVHMSDSTCTSCEG